MNDLSFHYLFTKFVWDNIGWTIANFLNLSIQRRRDFLYVEKMSIWSISAVGVIPSSCLSGCLSYLAVLQILQFRMIFPVLQFFESNNCKETFTFSWAALWARLCSTIIIPLCSSLLTMFVTIIVQYQILLTRNFWPIRLGFWPISIDCNKLHLPPLALQLVLSRR